MSKFPYRQDKEELKELLLQYNNLKNGRSHSFIDEEGFEMVVDYFDEREDYKQALEASNFGIEQFSYSSVLLIKKAALLITLKKYLEALNILEQAELFDSSDINLFILKTEAFLALDEQERAATVLEAAINLFENEEKVDLLFELADVYDDYENFEKVFDCLKIILDHDPINEEALYKICFWTDFTGRNEESIELHKAIIEEYPYSELAWFNLGAAYQGLKLYEKSIDAYLFAIAIDEKFDYAYRNLGDAYIRLKKYKLAIEVLEKVLELSMPETVIYEAIGHCYDKLYNYAQARFNYKKASHLSPEDGHMHYKIAYTYMNEESWVNAIKSLNLATKLNKLKPEYDLAIGKCYLELGDVDEAITHFGNVVRLRPKIVNGWIELLKALFLAELYVEGVDYSAFAFEQTNGKPIFLFFKSMFLFECGKIKEGLVILEEGLNLNPKLIKKFIEINPGILQMQKVVELIARYKKKNNFRK